MDKRTGIGPLANVAKSIQKDCQPPLNSASFQSNEVLVKLNKRLEET
jgi:hypothetical protein